MHRRSIREPGETLANRRALPSSTPAATRVLPSARTPRATPSPGAAPSTPPSPEVAPPRAIFTIPPPLPFSSACCRPSHLQPASSLMLSRSSTRRSAQQEKHEAPPSQSLPPFASCLRQVVVVRNGRRPLLWGRSPSLPPPGLSTRGVLAAAVLRLSILPPGRPTTWHQRRCHLPQYRRQR